MLENELPAVELSKVKTGAGFTLIVTVATALELDESTTVMLSM